ncbi:hypothetical protein Dsin_000130 [Dipteronia sinensis]|uniref:DUF4283 domain-containing protein n=1 Tax=Dipteronia sinensis TaxID=43782 RepID=A0AAE0DRW7_9ROSI|nr:hypothetical protein Dsin_000130 [Dipteronia sinensis]
MKAGEIERLYGALSLKEKVCPVPVQVLDTGLKGLGEQRLALCLVGKVLSTTLINREAFMSLIARIWRVTEEVEIEIVSGNIFAFHFKNAEDRQSVLSGSHGVLIDL